MYQHHGIGTLIMYKFGICVHLPMDLKTEGSPLHNSWVRGRLHRPKDRRKCQSTLLDKIRGTKCTLYVNVEKGEDVYNTEERGAFVILGHDSKIPDANLNSDDQPVETRPELKTNKPFVLKRLKKKKNRTDAQLKNTKNDEK